MVGQQDGDFDPILDDVSDDDPADVNMEGDDDAHRAPPQPAADPLRGRNDIDDLPPLEGYQRCVLLLLDASWMDTETRCCVLYLEQ